MAIFFHFNEISVSLRNRRKLKQFLGSVFEKEGYRAERIDYIFCTDRFLLKINRQYLHHDTLTDIITFDLSGPESGISAEIYISGERVLENAEQFGAGFEQELHRVIFHGVLHLCGYSDKTSEEKSRMRQKENEYLDLYFNN